MSKSAGLGQVRRSFQGKWQFPLLFCSIVLLAGVVVGMRPKRPVVTFEVYLKQIVALQKGGFYREAADLIGSLLGRERSDNETAQLHRHMARTIYLAEKKVSEHNEENLRRIIFNHRQATDGELLPTAGDLEQVARAYDWLGDGDQAVKHYRQTLALEPDRANRIRRRIIELLGLSQEVSPEQLIDQIDDLLAHSRDHLPDLMWGVERKVEVLVEEGRLADARGLIKSTRPALEETPLVGELDYLDGLTCFYAGDYDEAERRLRLLRNRLRPESELAAKTGWLLGSLDYRDGRPQYALSAFEDVLSSFAKGPYAAASKLGRAEALAALERYDEAAEAYAEVVALVESGAEGRLIDGAAVKTSLTSLHHSLCELDRLDEALRFVDLATKLVDAEEGAELSFYLGAISGLHEHLGRAARERASSVRQGSEGPSRQDLVGLAKGHFAAAAETLLRLAKVSALQEAVAADAEWRAAENFDLAGRTDRVVEVLEGFVGDRPLNSRTPRALFQLGQAYQASNRVEAAISSYRRLLQECPRTLAAFDSYVPLAQCFMAKGAEHYPQAEQVLLMVLEEDPTGPGFHTPRAPQFREALFRLGELYARQDKYEQAIWRLGDFLEYYPEDERDTRIRFMLAESYRRSGLALRDRSDEEVQVKVRGRLLEEFASRVRRASELYERVIAEYEQSGPESLAAKEALYLQLSYVYRADCYFDLGQYERAIELYEKAAYRYQGESLVLSAHIQIINCYYRLGQLDRAKRALERARWRLRQMPESLFGEVAAGRDRQWWREMLGWVGQSGVLDN